MLTTLKDTDIPSRRRPAPPGAAICQYRRDRVQSRGTFVYIGTSRLGRYMILLGVHGVRSLGCYGYVPAKKTLFDQHVRTLHDFGSAPHNFISFNPQGRLISPAGFGDLAGKTDAFDREMLTKVTTIDAPNTLHCEWSHSGRFLLTATLSHGSASTTASTYGNAPAHYSMSNQSKSCTKCRYSLRYQLCSLLQAGTSTGSCLRGKCQGQVEKS
ncbi:eukaryotic translation initiation factor eIF2A-domain-containing protein [Cyathus striatus]|nr:eukaryotic translation initiation factor eIF2A-domain-containing protein [Cyathus striatus]